MKSALLRLSLGMAFVGLSLCQTSHAALDAGDRLFVDFSRIAAGHGVAMPNDGPMDTNAGNSRGIADSNGNYWNNAWIPTAQAGGVTPPSVTNLVTSSNLGTGIGLTFSNGWQANGFQNGGLTEAQVLANQATLGDFAFRNALGDYYFLNAGDGPNVTSMTFTGLNPSLTYDFQIFATREAADVRKTMYSITDVNGLHTFELQTSGAGIGAGGYNGNNNTFATFSGIVPDEFGNITLSLQNTASNFAYIGALQLTAVPEPSAFGLAAAGCLALVALRRRRKA